jgi:hypothetical protein
VVRTRKYPDEVHHKRLGINVQMDLAADQLCSALLPVHCARLGEANMAVGDGSVEIGGC